MNPNRQRGLGMIAAIMVLLILSSLAAAIVSLSTGQQLASAQDILSTRAWIAASAGTEWGLHRALQGSSCAAASSWLHPDYADMRVTVQCTSKDYNDGETTPGTARQLRVFRIVATACNQNAANCPDAALATTPGYVERQRIATAYCEWD